MESPERPTSVQVTDELAERLADDAEAGYPPEQVQVRPTGRGRPRLAKGRGHPPGSTPGSTTSSLTCASSMLTAKVCTSPTSSARRCGPTSSEHPSFRLRSNGHGDPRDERPHLLLTTVLRSAPRRDGRVAATARSTGRLAKRVSCPRRSFAARAGMNGHQLGGRARLSSCRGPRDNGGCAQVSRSPELASV